MSFTHSPHKRLKSPSPSPPHLRIPVNILTQHQSPEVSKDPGPQSPAVAVSPPAGGCLLQVQATPPPSPTSLRRLSTSVYPPSSPRSGSPASTSPSPPPLPHQNRGEMHENKINADHAKNIFQLGATRCVPRRGAAWFASGAPLPPTCTRCRAWRGRASPHTTSSPSSTSAPSRCEILVNLFYPFRRS